MKSKWGAHHNDSSFVDSIDHSLHTIQESEGEEEKLEEEEELVEDTTFKYGPVTGLITYVDMGSDFYRDTDRETSGTLNEGEQKTKNYGLLSNIKGGEIIGGYLDSGANAHIFNTQNVFEKIHTQTTSIFTACNTQDNKNTNKGSVGRLKPIQFDTGIDINIEKAIYCKNLTENVVSVGNLCDNNLTVIYTNTGMVYTRE